MHRTGKTCEQQGFYRSNDCGYEVELLREEVFPECPVHDRPVTWTFIKQTDPPQTRTAKSKKSKSTKPNLSQ